MMDYPEIEMLVAGHWIKDGNGVEIFNPADGSVIGRAPNATPAQLKEAVGAATTAFKIWRSTAPREREKIFLRCVVLLRERINEIANAMTLEQGKPISESKQEVLRSCDAIEWEAAEARRLYGRIVPDTPDMLYTVVRQPIGVVAAFSPWNAPMNSVTRMVVSALAAGCTVVSKPSEETPASAMFLAKALTDAGLPAGALNLVFGNPSEISEFLIRDPNVRMITFTGSIPVGKHLSAMAGQYMKPVVMELGGHAPVIVCRDANPEAVGRSAASAKFRNAGQVCTSPTRFYVQKEIFQRFLDAFIGQAATIKVGDGLDPDMNMGPLTSLRRLGTVEALVKDAIEKGARLALGGERVGNKGYFFQPTVLADVPVGARVMSEEPFGPIALINAFDQIDDVVEMANSLPFGLTAYAFTDSARTIRKLTELLEVGNLCFNHFTSSIPEVPTGGVKDSGYGRAGGTEGQNCYTVVKNVSFKST